MTPDTTLVVILGASEFPEAGLERNSAFLRSARDFDSYVRETQGLALAAGNILNLFNSPKSQPDQDMELASHFRRHPDAQDLLVYYVGHGAFWRGKEYFLAIRYTRKDNPYFTSYPAAALANLLKQHARHLRRYLILDSCFSAAAFTEFQSEAPNQVALQQLKEELEPADLPTTGTALLCAASRFQPAKAPEGLAHTMFTEALLQVLEGKGSESELLSLAQVHERTWAVMQAQFGADAVRPELHLPDQRSGNIGKLAIFRTVGITADANAAHTIASAALSNTSIKFRKSFETVLPVSQDRLDDSTLPLLQPMVSTIRSAVLGPSSGGPTKLRLIRQFSIPGGGGVDKTLSFIGRSYRAAFTANGSQLIVTIDNSIKIYDLEGAEIASWVGDESWVNGAAISLDGTRLISGGTDQNVKLWDTKDRAELHQLSGHSGSIKSVAITSDGLMGASCSHDGSFILWDLVRGKSIWVNKDTNLQIYQVGFTADQTRFISCSDHDSTRNEVFRVWDVNTRDKLREFEWSSEIMPAFLLIRTPCFAVSTDSARIVTSSACGTTRVIELENGKVIVKFRTKAKNIRSIALTPNGGRAVFGSHDKRIQLWDLDKVNMTDEFVAAHRVQSCAVSSDGLSLAVMAGRQISLFSLV